MPSEEERAELVSPIVKAVAQLNEWRGATDTHLSFGGKDIDIEKRIREFKNVDEVVESGILSFIPPLAEKAQELELLASGVLPLSTHARGQLCLYIVPDEALRVPQEADALNAALNLLLDPVQLRTVVREDQDGVKRVFVAKFHSLIKLFSLHPDDLKDAAWYLTEVFQNWPR